MVSPFKPPGINKGIKEISVSKIENGSFSFPEVRTSNYLNQE